MRRILIARRIIFAARRTRFPIWPSKGNGSRRRLWIYGNDSPQRKAAWARLSDDEIVISDRAGREIRVDIRYPKLAAEKLTSLMGPDLKLRPCALMTTMYARLVLSDLFLHGIGGGKYDQLGDMIMRSFFMITPPQIMVISATVQCPVCHPTRRPSGSGSCSERYATRSTNRNDSPIGSDWTADCYSRKLSSSPKFPKRESGVNGIVNSSRSTRSFHSHLRELRMKLRADLASSGVKRRRSRSWPVASIPFASSRSSTL